MKKIDLVGQKFGRLTVIALAPKLSKDRRWLCKCDCGNLTIAVGGNLKSGHTTSCGCRRIEVTKVVKTTHGKSKNSSEYKSWAGMKDRCHNPNHTRYPEWGGRGIVVCAEWRHDFSAFFSYMGPKPSAEHSIDRINNNGNYEPGNVRWATRSEQAQNKRNNAKHGTLHMARHLKCRCEPCITAAREYFAHYRERRRMLKSLQQQLEDK